MAPHPRLHAVRAVAGLSLGALLLTACSTDSLLERGLSQIEGVDDVEIDRESGSFAIRGEEGEVFEVEVDEGTGTSTITTEEGTVTTGGIDELPSEVAEVFTPPPAFQPQAVTDLTEDGTRGLMVQGTIEGDWAELMDSIEAAVTAGSWDEVQRQTMLEGVMAAVVATTEGEPGSNLTVSLMMDENETEGLLSILLVEPTTE
ncbi:MAG: hypothetical protein EA387_04330 [Nitriliruptor sp.]|nr:MAG: hypothetical protein EA387_04330 [Nitriliruptor sp.]